MEKRPWKITHCLFCANFQSKLGERLLACLAQVSNFVFYSAVYGFSIFSQDGFMYAILTYNCQRDSYNGKDSHRCQYMSSWEVGTV